MIEAIFVCEASAIVRQYHIGHKEGALEIRDRVFYNHRDKMLKLMSLLNFDVDRSMSEAVGFLLFVRDLDERWWLRAWWLEDINPNADAWAPRKKSLVNCVEGLDTSVLQSVTPGARFDWRNLREVMKSCVQGK